MVAEPDKVWLGVEYFCNQGDEIWNRSQEQMAQLAIGEMHKIGIIHRADVLDSHVVKIEKAYPAYFGTYKRFNELRTYLDRYENLFLIGRNGMHKYNNQDHAMLTAMTAVDCVLNHRVGKEDIWSVNTELEYHENRTESGSQ